ncbi:MAG: transposase [Hyphomicrobiaceae bacterium]
MIFQAEVCQQFHALVRMRGMIFQATDIPQEVAPWLLLSLQTRLFKIGARVVHHARPITFQLAEVTIPRVLFRRSLEAINQLRPSPMPS